MLSLLTEQVEERPILVEIILELSGRYGGES